MKRLGLGFAFAFVLSLMSIIPGGAVSDSLDGITVHPFTMPVDTGCVQWFDQTEGTTYNCDPVDLVFKGLTLSQVEVRLIAAGWTTSGLGSDQWLHFDTPTLIVEDAQLYLPQDWYHRYHIRLWQVPGHDAVVGAVHHESGLFTHVIDQSWDAAEAFVAGQMCGSTSGLTCESNAFMAQQFQMQGDTDQWRGWTNDALATVVESVPAPMVLNVAVTTDRSSYRNRDKVHITVTLTDANGAGVAGALVAATVTGPSGRQESLSGTANAQGVATMQFRVNSRKYGTGEYSVVATATASGYAAGSGSATFVVTP